jgi:hypothetical protein
MTALVCLFGVLFIALYNALFVIDAQPLLFAVIMLSYAYMVLSLLFNIKWNIITQPFSPVVLYKIITFVGIFVNIVTDTSYFNNSENTTSIAFLGLIFLILIDFVGYLFNKNALASYNCSSMQFSERKNASMIFFSIYVIGWFWRIYAISHGLLYGTNLGTRLELTNYSNLLGTLNSLSTICFWGMYVFSAKVKRLAPLFMLEIVWMAVSGSKSSTAIMLVSWLFVEFIRGTWRVNNRSVIIGSLVVIVSILSFSVIHQYRIESQRIIIASGYQSFSPIDAFRNINMQDVSGLAVINGVSDRLNLGWRFSHVVTAVDRGHTDLWYGESFHGLLYLFIPRALWPNKPKFSIGRWFAEKCLGWEEDSRAEAGITMWGEGYLNFGFIGALLIPTIWVAFVQWIYILCIRLREFTLIFYASAHNVILGSLSANVVSPFAAFCQYALIIFFISFIIKTFNRHRMNVLEI